MKKILLTSFTILLYLLNTAFADSQGPDFDALFNKWNNALLAGASSSDPNVVASLYEEDAVLLPTLSKNTRFGRAAIANYFIEFLKKCPRAELTEIRFTKIFNENAAVDTGVYKFTLKNQHEIESSEGNLCQTPGTKIVYARYTFVYELKNNQWMITVHHSSVMPENEKALLEEFTKIKSQIESSSLKDFFIAFENDEFGI